MSPTIALIKRGPRPGYSRAPFHPVVIVAKKRLLEWERGWTGDGATVWEHERGTGGGGWLLTRWAGFDIDYGHTVRCVTLPDGTTGAFAHDENQEPWTLLTGAVWLDDKRLPQWLDRRGAIYPPDRFTRNGLLDRIADDCVSGIGRESAWPPFWPTASPKIAVEISDQPRIPNGAAVAITVGQGRYATPATAVVESLTRTSEWTNDGYERYGLRLADGSATSRDREYLERKNPGSVR